MDIPSIGMAFNLTKGAAAQATQAAQNANSAATDANNAKNAANAAAQAANQAAAEYSNIDGDAAIDRTAFNYAWTLLQAELRDVQKRLATAETKLTALT